MDLSPADLATLREHGIVIFAGRVIFAAEPPMPAEAIAEVEAQSIGPLPPALLELWRETAGGELDYDLTLAMNGNEEALSWCELFFNGSERYNDLRGWIAHELELAEEAADDAGEPWNGKLSYVPIGGFEYLDRVYVVTKEGPEHGAVLAWKQGLPPAWELALHEDASTTIASDLHAAFAALHLKEDPLVSDRGHGGQLLEYLEKREGLAPALKDRLIAYYRRAILDWRASLADGTLRDKPGLARVALEHAITADDAALIAQLARAGAPLAKPLRGSAGPVIVAMGAGTYAAAKALVAAGAPVPAKALAHVDSAVPPELTALLLARGAKPSAEIVANLIACGAAESARLAAAAIAGDPSAAIAEAKRSLRAKLEADLARVVAGKLGHYLGRAGLAERVERLGEA